MAEDMLSRRTHILCSVSTKSLVLILDLMRRFDSRCVATSVHTGWLPVETLDGFLSRIEF